jgi:hypothetical protein
METRGKDPLAGRFSGTVESDDGPIVVKNGFAVVDGELFMVSDDGVVITNKDGGIIGIISNGRVKQLTPEIVDQLRRRGYVK